MVNFLMMPKFNGNCLFCGHKTILSYPESSGTSIYDCNDCPCLVAFYVPEGSDLIIKTAFFLHKESKLYLWTNDYNDNKTCIREIQTDLIVSRPLVLQLPKLVSGVNPSNVWQKLSLYLTFL